MLTQKEIEQVIDGKTSIKDFCESKKISKRTFYNYVQRYGIKSSKQKKANDKIKSSVGNKYNRWTVLEFVGRKDGQSAMMMCKCDCGTEQAVRYYDLVSGQTKGCSSCSTVERSKNCGKYERKTGEKNWKFSGYRKITGQYWSVIKHRAKKTGKELSISIEYAYSLLEKQNFKCKISGLEIELPSCDKRAWTATLDRIDSSKGYVEGNVQWLHKDINTMKWDFTQEKFIEYCKIITERQKK